MNVTVHSRESIEQLIASGNFPQNTAVISFYDPAIKRIDKDYTHVDYSSVCSDVFYSELDDLDLEVLPEKGYTYATYFPEAGDIAAFIYQAHRQGKDIICQCEYGQSRSAGCAAAILEHFEHSGISVFADYAYYPNQVVYHKVFDALEREKLYQENRYYFAADADAIAHHLAKMQLPATFLEEYEPEDGRSVLDLKETLERYLTEQHLLYHSAEEILDTLRSSEQPVYASFSVSDPDLMCDPHLWTPYAVFSHLRYGAERIPIVFWFNRFRSAKIWKGYRKGWKSYAYTLGCEPLRSFSFFGKLTWDGERRMIDAVPLFVTNIKP